MQDGVRISSSAISLSLWVYLRGRVHNYDPVVSHIASTYIPNVIPDHSDVSVTIREVHAFSRGTWVKIFLSSVDGFVFYRTPIFAGFDMVSW